MEKDIVNYLEKTFHVGFYVKKINGNYEEYEVGLKDTFKDTFKLMVTIKDDIRLTIVCEPDVFGMLFVENINKSPIDKRNVFIDYWKLLGEDLVEVKINDKNYNIDEFVIDNSKWNKFFLRFTKVAYFDSEKENRNDVILEYISLIVAMIFSITTYEIIGVEGKVEGNKYTDETTKYERNPINRKLCLSIKGYKCSVCGFDFEKEYGIIGKEFIEVHHAIPVSQMGENYKVDPIKDLFPLCPNCHAMIHKKNPPYTIDELKEIMKERRDEKNGD